MVECRASLAFGPVEVRSGSLQGAPPGSGSTRFRNPNIWFRRYLRCSAGSSRGGCPRATGAGGVEGGRKGEGYGWHRRRKRKSKQGCRRCCVFVGAFVPVRPRSKGDGGVAREHASSPEHAVWRDPERLALFARLCSNKFFSETQEFLEKSAWHMNALQLGLLARYFSRVLDLVRRGRGGEENETHGEPAREVVLLESDESEQDGAAASPAAAWHVELHANFTGTEVVPRSFISSSSSTFSLAARLQTTLNEYGHGLRYFIDGKHRGFAAADKLALEILEEENPLLQNACVVGVLAEAGRDRDVADERDLPYYSAVEEQLQTTVHAIASGRISKAQIFFAFAGAQYHEFFDQLRKAVFPLRHAEPAPQENAPVSCALLLLPAEAIPAGNVLAAETELLRALHANRTAANSGGTMEGVPELVSVTHKVFASLPSEQELSRSLTAGAVDEQYAADFLQASRWHLLQQVGVSPGENPNLSSFGPRPRSRLTCAGIAKRLRKGEDAFYVPDLQALLRKCASILPRSDAEKIAELEVDLASPGFLHFRSDVAEDGERAPEQGSHKWPPAKWRDERAASMIGSVPVGRASHAPRGADITSRAGSADSVSVSAPPATTSTAHQPPAIVFSYLATVGPCRELFGSLVFDFVETLQVLSVQGTQSFLQLPRLAYTEYKKFEPLSCPDCSHDDPQEYWNQTGRACDVRTGGSVSFAQIFDATHLDRFLQSRFGMGGVVVRAGQGLGHQGDYEHFDSVLMTADLPLANSMEAQYACSDFVDVAVVHGMGSIEGASVEQPRIADESVSSGSLFRHEFFASGRHSEIDSLTCVRGKDDIVGGSRLNVTAIRAALDRIETEGRKSAARTPGLAASRTTIAKWKPISEVDSPCAAAAEGEEGEEVEVEGHPSSSTPPAKPKGEMTGAMKCAAKNTSNQDQPKQGAQSSSSTSLLGDRGAVRETTARSERHAALRHRSTRHVGLFFYFLEEYESDALHFARYGSLRASALGPSAWSGMRFAPRIEELGNGLLAAAGLRGSFGFAVHWRRGDRELGSQRRKLDQYKEALPEQLAEIIGRKWRSTTSGASASATLIFVMTNEPVESAAMSELASVLQSRYGLTTLRVSVSTEEDQVRLVRYEDGRVVEVGTSKTIPILGGGSGSGTVSVRSGVPQEEQQHLGVHPLELLALEMYVATARSAVFLGYGDGIVDGYCSAPSLIVHQMRLHTYGQTAAKWVFEEID